MAGTRSDASPRPAARVREDAGSQPVPRGVVVAGALVVAAGVVLRLWSPSDLWADEAITAAIAGLPVGDLLDALRQDGHPPGYYLLLSGWTAVVGDGDGAVRALSSTCSLLALPLAWRAGTRLGGRTAGAAALLLLASSPFAVRYATEARMYALVVLLVLAGWLALRSALDDPRPRRLVPVALVAGALLLTHYWAAYLLAAVLLALVAGARRSADGGRAARRVALAVAAGGLLFLPWLPSALHQLRTTGTPWGAPPRPGALLLAAFGALGDGAPAEALLVAAGLLVLVVLALFGRRRGDRVELGLLVPRLGGPEVAVVGALCLMALVASHLSGAAFATRYLSVGLPLVLVVAAAGASRLPARARWAAVGSLAGLGLVAGSAVAVEERTQAGEVAAALERTAGRDDVVVYCPDQLAPAVRRLLAAPLATETLPAGADPDRVDWTDYGERARRSDPVALASRADGRAGPGAVWLVWSGGYRTLGRRCEDLAGALGRRRGAPELVVSARAEAERASLWRYEASGPAPAP